MKCPACSSEKHSVVHSTRRQNQVTRRRKCVSCGEKFTTRERLAELSKEENEELDHSPPRGSALYNREI